MAKDPNNPKRKLTREEVSELIAMEGELQELRETYGIEEKGTLLDRAMRRYYAFKEAHTHKKRVYRKKYLKLCWLGLFGAHQFYAGHWVRGILYLLIFWTGISVGMTLIDVMIAVPMTPDEEGMIEI